MSNDLTPFHYERLVIAYLLTYKEAAGYVIPYLTYDKFLHSKEGRLDGARDHARIYQAMTLVHQVSKLPITIPNVLDQMQEDKRSSEYLFYLSSLEQSLPGYYRVRDFDAASLMNFAENVDKAGVMYRAAAKSYKLAKLIESPEQFAKEVSQVPDVTDWLRTYVSDVSAVAGNKTNGYKHISSSVDKAMALADRIHRGEQVMLLPTGLPSLKVPRGKLIILMGESNSGKSVVTHQICLGTAIGLKRYGIRGCVAVNSLEEREDPFTLKMASMLSGVDMWEFQYGNGITDSEKYRLDRALEYVAELPLYLDTTNNLAINKLDFRLTGLHASEMGPVQLMSVDYLERLDLSADHADTREQELATGINHFADIVEENDLTVIAISQVTQGNSGNAKARIAGAAGTRGSRGIQFAADDMWEVWNPLEMVRAGTDFVVPEGLNKDCLWLLNPKKRYGPKFSPIAFGWEGAYTRIFDLELNRSGNSEITLFSHPLPSFEEVEAGF